MKDIKVLGVGCPNCKKTEALIRKAADEKNWNEGTDYKIEKVTSPGDIASYGVFATPGIVIDGKVISTGKVPSANDIKSWLNT